MLWVDREEVLMRAVDGWRISFTSCRTQTSMRITTRRSQNRSVWTISA